MYCSCLVVLFEVSVFYKCLLYLNLLSLMVVMRWFKGFGLFIKKSFIFLCGVVLKLIFVYGCGLKK